VKIEIHLLRAPDWKKEGRSILKEGGTRGNAGDQIEEYRVQDGEKIIEVTNWKYDYGWGGSRNWMNGR